MIDTVAGNGTAGFGDSEDARQGMFNGPGGAVIDNSGRVIIADLHNHRIRVYDPARGSLGTIVGNGQPETSPHGTPVCVASVHCPHASGVDPQGRIYAVESWGNVITRVNPETRCVERVAGTGEPGFSGDGGPADRARLHEPAGASFDAEGNLYFNDFRNNRIRMVATDGTIRTVAGTGEMGHTGDGGPAIAATLRGPYGVACDRWRGLLYIADHGNACIRRVDLHTGIIVTVAGCGRKGFAGDGGQASYAMLSDPHGVATDTRGNLYIADTGNCRVRKVDFATGMISTFAGNGEAAHGGDGGDALEASFLYPAGVAVSTTGEVYVPDYRAHCLRKIQRRHEE